MTIPNDLERATGEDARRTAGEAPALQSFFSGL
jgi:hypothetical protein